MTLTYSQAKVVYQGDGETTQWAIPFPYLQTADLQVVRIGADGTESVLSGDFTVDTDLNVLLYPMEGSQTLPLAEGEKLLLRRRTPLTQQAAFGAQQSFDPAVLEAGYDKAMMIAQEQAEELARAVRFPASSAGIQTDAAHYLQELQQAQLDADKAYAAAQSAVTVAQSALQTAQQAVDSASASAETVTGSVSAAQSAAAAAQTSAGSADTFAQAASSSQQAAAGSATAASASADLAQEWAVKMDGAVTDGEYSAKYHAQQAEASATAAEDFASTATTQATNAADSAELAHEWATQTDSEVAPGQGYGAKKYAQDAAQSASSAAQSAIDAANSAASARGLQIGAVYFSQSSLATDNPGGLPLWTGEYFSNASSLYPDFYAWVKSHTELCKSKTEYDAAISTYGESPYYVVDEVEGSLRLPKYALPKRELTASKAATENDPSWYNLYSDGWLEQGGTVVAPQTVTLVKNFASTDYEVLLSVKGYDNTTNWCPVANTKTVNSFYINSVGNGPQVVWRAYGWSGPVLQNMARYPWIYAFNSAVSAGEVQAAEFTGALVSKADTDLSNVSSNIDYVVESYTDAETGQWYRLWKSGWLEQGGFLPGPTPGGSTTTVTFLKEFNDLNYYPVFTNCWDGYVENGTSINNLTTTGMNIPWYASRGTERSRWYACGQASTEE